MRALQRCSACQARAETMSASGAAYQGRDKICAYPMNFGTRLLPTGILVDDPSGVPRHAGALQVRETIQRTRS